MVLSVSQLNPPHETRARRYINPLRETHASRYTVRIHTGVLSAVARPAVSEHFVTSPAVVVAPPLHRTVIRRRKRDLGGNIDRGMVR
jgi:hypothetical protein